MSAEPAGTAKSGELMSLVAAEGVVQPTSCGACSGWVDVREQRECIEATATHDSIIDNQVNQRPQPREVRVVCAIAIGMGTL
jgi:hypothetical protein